MAQGEQTPRGVSINDGTVIKVKLGQVIAVVISISVLTWSWSVVYFGIQDMRRDIREIKAVLKIADASETTPVISWSEQ